MKVVKKEPKMTERRKGCRHYEMKDEDRKGRKRGTQVVRKVGKLEKEDEFTVKG